MFLHSPSQRSLLVVLVTKNLPAPSLCPWSPLHRTARPRPILDGLNAHGASRPADATGAKAQPSPHRPSHAAHLAVAAFRRPSAATGGRAPRTAERPPLPHHHHAGDSRESSPRCSPNALVELRAGSPCSSHRSTLRRTDPNPLGQ